MAERRFLEGVRMIAEPEHLGIEGVDTGELHLLLQWENRRLRFNLILLGLTTLLVLFFRLDLLFDRRFCIVVLIDAILANICFCVGPVLDGYVHRMGFGGSASARWIYRVGLLLAFPITALTVFFFRP